jgi:transposase
MDDSGKVLRKERLDTQPEVLTEYFSTKVPGPGCVTMETTWNWYWVSDLMQRMGFNVKLAHAKKTRIIAEGTHKTDEIDSEVLAHLERTNFLPQAYIPTLQVRNDRELLRYRIGLVKTRTAIKNRIHALLAKSGVTYHHVYCDLFGKAGSEFLGTVELPQVYRDILDGWLKVLKNIHTVLNDVEKAVKTRVIETPEAKLLMTIPGFSFFSALLVAMEIGDIQRFKSVKKLCAYAGVVSGRDESGEKTYQGHIITDCNRYLRWCLVEAVEKAKRKDPRLERTYSKVSRKAGVKRARIAVARKLAVSIYYMLKKKETYRPEYKKALFSDTIGSLRVSPVRSMVALQQTS